MFDDNLILILYALQILSTRYDPSKNLVSPLQMSSQRFNLKVYIIHVKTLANRKSLCDRLHAELAQAESFDLESFEYITSNDPNEITDTISVDQSPIPSDNGNFERLNTFLRPLKVVHVSNAMKHKQALEAIANATDEKTIHLVIEDDSLKQSTEADFLDKAMTTFSSEKLSVMFLGIPPGVAARNGKQLVSDVYNALPCCDSYFITPKAAKTTLEHFTPLKFPTNIQLTYALAKAQVITYMSAPAIFVDGSKLGVFASTIDSNNRLVFNGHFVAIAKAIQDNLPEETIDALFTKAEPKWHPEFMHLQASYEKNKGNFRQAEQYYSEALNQYIAFGGIIDNQTELLRDFMRLYRHLQAIPS